MNLIVISNIGPWSAGITETERIARCRKLRALALVYLGPEHPLTAALGEAITDGGALETARAQLGAIPALRRRRLLAAYIALLRAARPRQHQATAIGAVTLLPCRATVLAGDLIAAALPTLSAP